MKGTWKNPAIGSVRANGVVIAPEAGVLPLLFIEVDNCAEEAVLIAAKFDKYARFFKRKEKDTDGIEEPPWRTRWSAPASEGYGSTDCGRKFEEQAAAQKAEGLVLPLPHPTRASPAADDAASPRRPPTGGMRTIKSRPRLSASPDRAVAGQPPGHQRDFRPGDQRLRVLDQPSVVPGVSAGVHDPGRMASQRPSGSRSPRRDPGNGPPPQLSHAHTLLRQAFAHARRRPDR